jgi:hypothetical protein
MDAVLVAVFSGFFESILRERAGFDRPTFGRLFPPRRGCPLTVSPAAARRGATGGVQQERFAIPEVIGQYCCPNW